MQYSTHDSDWWIKPEHVTMHSISLWWCLYVWVQVIGSVFYISTKSDLFLICLLFFLINFILYFGLIKLRKTPNLYTEPAQIVKKNICLKFRY